MKKIIPLGIALVAIACLFVSPAETRRKSAEAGTGATSNAASITAVLPPTISKAFGAASIFVGGSTTLTLTITNPNASVDLTGVAFTDNLPSGLAVADSPSSSTTCGGTFAPSAGDTTLTFSGGTVTANSSCTVSVDVKGTSAGVQHNTTGAISSTESGPGTTSNTADVTVLACPASFTVNDNGDAHDAIPAGFSPVRQANYPDEPGCHPGRYERLSPGMT